jgi:mRNA-degrading endonuclease toxin of MazEF toxin-antitoxin module
VKEAFAKAGLRLHLSPGTIVSVKDKRVVFPLNWIRRSHERRFCLALSNDTLCATQEILLIAPCTTSVESLSQSDLIINPDKKNGLEKPSAILLGQVQPILYEDIIQKMGELSDRDWDLVIRKLFWIVDRA